MEKHGLTQSGQMLIKGAKVIDPRSIWNNRVVDILIDQGKIVEISSELHAERAMVVDATGCWLSPGWTDLRTFVRVPGMEQQETVETALNAAAAGGFTAVLAHSSKDALIGDSSVIQFLFNRAAKSAVDLMPCGALTQSLEGLEMCELYDMYTAGAVAFSNGNQTYCDHGLLQRALQYCQGFNALVLSHALDETLTHGGVVNESENTIHTGLKLSPALAEFSTIQREIEIARYCDAGIHFSHISSARSVELIKAAKADGLKVSCDVSIMHLCFTEEEIMDYNSQFKLQPPLRTEHDRKALIAGINDGTIDAVVSDHQPLNIEYKQLEFDYAEAGNTNLQTVFSLYMQYLAEDISVENWTKALSLQPAALLNKHKPIIETGNAAELALFNPSKQWAYNDQSNLSKSYNHPLFGTILTGKCEMILNKGLSQIFNTI